ncbi:hypothetical protein B0A64_09770 [Flavobacterium araucananum]|uniref:Uncharacterized protein n=1 Tax=Flavobacterium araucananum TaxID=946678 RepID=A0A227PB05_9FLAO|nr:hypothetical protein B0A64_09770 [Flavobacterium araucananum]
MSFYHNRGILFCYGDNTIPFPDFLDAPALRGFLTSAAQMSLTRYKKIAQSQRHLRSFSVEHFGELGTFAQLFS